MCEKMFNFAPENKTYYQIMFSIKDISEYIVLLIAAFASHYQMSDIDAYRYLSRYVLSYL